jgi:hypothetical protein
MLISVIRGSGRVEMYHVIMGYLAAVDIVNGKWLRKRAEVVGRDTYTIFYGIRLERCNDIICNDLTFQLC